MSRRESGGLVRRRGRARAYVRRFFTSWVASDPDPKYSLLDRRDGLGQVPDPVCTPRRQLPESPEVAAQRTDRPNTQVGGSAAGAAGAAGAAIGSPVRR